MQYENERIYHRVFVDRLSRLVSAVDDDNRPIGALFLGTEPFILDKRQVKNLIKYLQNWVETGKLKNDTRRTKRTTKKPQTRRRNTVH
jgi:50S ribosomal subunit-associated GTPase HflX